ncbi:MAG TPA: hypothetical protein PKB10_12900, partial [Tepidisphaeraceae bacterium]|nr:hypothetical protein [Tepidisphaeraceae bacterium]
MNWLVAHPLAVIALLPALSAGVVALSARRAGRWIALSGTILTLLGLLIVPIFAHADADHRVAGGSITVARGLVLELSMDGIARALSRLLGLIAVVVVVLTWERPGGLRRFHAMPMLALSFALVSVFASTPLTIVIGLLLTSATAGGLLWSAGELPAAARLTGTHAVSAALAMIALACGMRGGDGFIEASAWLAIGAVLLRLGIVPLHAWVGSAMSA